MISTISPAGCGGRHRRNLALAAFALGAIAASAALGLALGALGGLAGADRLGVALAVGALALVAAAREAGLVALPLPQVRRQVPERWRREWPLPLWSAAYGAGLGLGVLTHQAVATFWVVCAAAVWLAEPLPAATVLAAFGAGRALGGQGGRERVLATRPLLLRINAVVLVLCAALVVVPAADARPHVLNLGPGAQDDPAFSNGVLAFTQRGPGAGVVIAPPDAPRVTFPGAAGVALDEGLVAFRDSAGIVVFDWHSGTPVARVDAPGADRPALDWPWLAYRRPAARGARVLVLRDLTTGTERVVAIVKRGDDLSRPALGAGRLAWAAVTRSGSTVRVLAVPWGAPDLLRRSHRLVLTAPALSTRSVGWVEQGVEGSAVVVRPLVGGGRQVIARLPDGTRRYVGLALEGRGAWASYWDLRRGITRIHQIGY